MASWISNSDPDYHTIKPEWTYLNGRTEINVKDKFHYGHGNIIYGNTALSDIEYTGEYRVESESVAPNSDAHIGIIFSYQVKYYCQVSLLFMSSSGSGPIQVKVR